MVGKREKQSRGGCSQAGGSGKWARRGSKPFWTTSYPLWAKARGAISFLRAQDLVGLTVRISTCFPIVKVARGVFFQPHLRFNGQQHSRRGKETVWHINLWDTWGEFLRVGIVVMCQVGEQGSPLGRKMVSLAHDLGSGYDEMLHLRKAVSLHVVTILGVM